MAYKIGGILMGEHDNNPYKKQDCGGKPYSGEITFANRGYITIKCGPTIVESTSDLSIADQLKAIREILGLNYVLLGKAPQE